MSLPKVLIVEDEPGMVVGLRDNFEYDGYEVVVAGDGEAAISRALNDADRPDIVLLDVMLPKLSGLDVCRRLRAKGFDAPILMLTARRQEMDKVLGLEIGADDYITKPFSVRELMARVRAHLRRSARNHKDLAVFKFGDVELDFRKYEARRSGQAIELSPREFEILKYLIQRQGETVTREQLLDEVWGYDNFPITRTVDNHIAKLRQKLEISAADPRHIITVHRVGYRFIP
jgi:two-component system alkaline phosphatase synthesis response regulator PhoP